MREFDTEGSERRSNLRSDVRVGDLVEGLERPVGEGIATTKQLSKGYYRTVKINPSNLPSSRVVPT